jgi:hypothetical protein
MADVDYGGLGEVKVSEKWEATVKGHHAISGSAAVFEPRCELVHCIYCRLGRRGRFEDEKEN